MTSLDAGLAAKVVRTSEALASRSWIWMATYSLIFLPLTLLLSSRYAFWYDEIHTIYLSRLPSVRQIWLALAEGADLQPPLVYLTTRLAHSIFGYSEWAARLPSTIGVLVAGLCLMFFVARRTSMLWGFLAAVFILLTGVYPHAIEARPYGLVLGFAGTALVCWQCAAEERHRKLALTGLTASLMLAVSSHYYAVLLLVPIALGEAVRNYANRRIDRGIWCSILTAAPTIFLFLPLLGKSMKAVVNGRTTQVTGPWVPHR